MWTIKSDCQIGNTEMRHKGSETENDLCLSDGKAKVWKKERKDLLIIQNKQVQGSTMVVVVSWLA